jgi:hypothetical protein
MEKEPKKRLTIEERIAALDARRKNLQARLSKSRRSEDTRIKILFGALMLEVAKRDPQVARAALAAAPKFFTRDNDRKVMTSTLAEIQKLISGTPAEKPAKPGTFTPRPDNDAI